MDKSYRGRKMKTKNSLLVAHALCSDKFFPKPAKQDGDLVLKQLNWLTLSSAGKIRANNVD
jgi:hypothetical protein